MDAGIVTGVAGSLTAVAVAFINRGTAAGVAELRKQLDLYIGTDNKAGPETEIGKLKVRLASVEATIGTAASLAALPAEVERLRVHVDSQLQAARVEWEAWKHRNRRPTTSHPTFSDEDARRMADDALRRVQDVEREVDEIRREQAATQHTLGRILGRLESLVEGRGR